MPSETNSAKTEFVEAPVSLAIFWTSPSKLLDSLVVYCVFSSFTFSTPHLQKGLMFSMENLLDRQPLNRRAYLALKRMKRKGSLPVPDSDETLKDTLDGLCHLGFAKTKGYGKIHHGYGSVRTEHVPTSYHVTPAGMNAVTDYRDAVRAWLLAQILRFVSGIIVGFSVGILVALTVTACVSG